MQRKSNKPKKHHYVPQFYLKQFSSSSDANKVPTLRFNGPNVVVGKPAIANIGYEENWDESNEANFLTHLAINRRVAPNTQNQALNALVFLYRHVLDTPLQELKSVKRASGKQKLPAVLNQNEIRCLLKHSHAANTDRQRP